jgi:hypothetical protein
MKKNFFILLILPALACFAGTKIQAPITPITATAVGAPAFISTVINDFPSPTATQMTMCIVTVKSLNVRSNPESNVVGWLYSGDLVSNLEDTPRGAWIHIQAGEVTGWINSKYCKRKN